jgi:cellulose synthase/poly-beta-1,6-N-acetylglucosamine synthase-like glycosyltransferase
LRFSLRQRRAAICAAPSPQSIPKVRRYHAYVALIVVALAILGALLHPLSLILGLAPFDTRGFVAFLVRVRETIADLLGWAVLSVLAVMVFYVVRGRRPQEARRAVLNPAGAGNQAPGGRDVPRVAVAITAYNDAEATAQAVKDFRMQPSVVKVLVIDNNSSDDTAALAEAAGGTVIREAKQGYGYACMRGLAEGLKVPEADVVVLTEGDGTFFADDLPKFLSYVDQADLVVGNRVVRGLVDSDSQMDYFFTWGNMAVAMLIRLRFWDGRHLGPAGLMDVGCTYRAIRRQALEDILPDLRVGGNHFSPHMLLVAMAHDLSVIEIPIRLRRRVGDSKGASQSFWKGLHVGLTMIWHVMTFQLKSSGPSVPTEEPGPSAPAGLTAPGRE